MTNLHRLLILVTLFDLFENMGEDIGFTDEEREELVKHSEHEIVGLGSDEELLAKLREMARELYEDMGEPPKEEIERNKVEEKEAE